MKILNLFRNQQSVAAIAQAPERELDEQVLLNVNGGHGNDSYHRHREYHRGGEHHGYERHENHHHDYRHHDNDCD